MSAETDPIPQEWILAYVDKLIAVAQTMPEDSSMYKSSLLRASYAMDLMEAFRESMSN